MSIGANQYASTGLYVYVNAIKSQEIQLYQSNTVNLRGISREL